MRLARFGLLVAACTAALVPALPARAATPREFVGMYSEDAFYRSDDYYRAVAFARQAAAGIGVERIPFDWRLIEPAPGSYDFAPYDAFVGAAAAAGLRVLPVVGNAPAFVSAAPSGSGGWYPPSDPADLAAFARVLVTRYGPGGSFWSDHSALPSLPITAWQIWNEPNLPIFWGGAPDAAAYVRLLRAAGDAIHSADPGATVVSAGLPDSATGVPLGAYVDELFAAGFAGSFDVFGLHGYAPGPTGTLDLVAYARELLRSHGEDAPIWLTEFGWATDGSSDWFTVSEAEQAARVRATLEALWSERAALGLRGAVYFKWRDSLPAPGARDAWPLHTGLLRGDASAKPALAALEAATAGMQEPPAAGNGSVPGGGASATDPATGTGPSDPAVDAPASTVAGRSGLAVRWVELRGHRVRLHVTCAAGHQRCRGHVRVGRPHTAAGRGFSIPAGMRAVLALQLPKRSAIHMRWLTVRISSAARGEAPRVSRFLVRRLRGRMAAWRAPQSPQSRAPATAR